MMRRNIRVGSLLIVYVQVFYFTTGFIVTCFQSSSSNHEAYEPYLEEMREISKIGRVPSNRCSEDEESLEESAKEQGKLLIHYRSALTSFLSCYRRRC